MAPGGRVGGGADGEDGRLEAGGIPVDRKLGIRGSGSLSRLGISLGGSKTGEPGVGVGGGAEGVAS